MQRRFLQFSGIALLTLLTGCAQLDGRSAAPLPAAQAGTIFVSAGDTVDGLAARYGVSRQDLINANRLTPPFSLQPGQRLQLPQPDTYIVQRGDTLSGIARRYQMDMNEIVRLNGLQPPYTILVDQALRLPGQTGTARPSVATLRPGSEPARTASRSTHDGSSATTLLSAPPSGITPPAPKAVPQTPYRTPQSGEQRSATPPSSNGQNNIIIEKLPPLASGSVAATTAEIPAPSSTRPLGNATPPVEKPPVFSQPSGNTAGSPAVERSAGSAAAVAPPVNSSREPVPPPRAGTRFLWPVQGSVLSGYGSKEGGLKNDGINIAVPRGTPVRAADKGVVAYSGNELRGFGNLLLIRHADSWVTAYAHLEQIDVQRGQQVERGQVIGKVGQTGNVRSPQLHFEVRRGSQPVDPTGYMEQPEP
jgi:murein DD-endopeptidase MepM/ murein hydrolase activator NlpD